MNISVKKSIISNETVEISNFHFSHYLSMETKCCHSNQSSYPTEIKHITFVRGNGLCKNSVSEKKYFEYFFRKFTLYFAP